jgi:hypothetical protein
MASPYRPRISPVPTGLLAALVLLACSPSPSGTDRSSVSPPAVAGPAGQSNSAEAPLKARSAYTSINAVCAPWWMALEAGYFREQGLDVELGHVDPGATLVAAMTNGELDITFAAGPTLVLGSLQGLDTIFIGSTSNALDSVILARPEIQSPSDLRGKTIGVNRLRSLGDVTARLMLQRVGLQPDVDVFTRGTGGQAEALAALQIGAVDGISVSPPIVFDARKLGYRELLSAPELGIPFLSGGIGRRGGCSPSGPSWEGATSAPSRRPSAVSRPTASWRCRCSEGTASSTTASCSALRWTTSAASTPWTLILSRAPCKVSSTRRTSLPPAPYVLLT